MNRATDISSLPLVFSVPEAAQLIGIGKNTMYYMRFEEMYSFWKRMKSGGRKSFRFDEIGELFELHRKGEFLCHYLEGLNYYLSIS